MAVGSASRKRRDRVEEPALFTFGLVADVQAGAKPDMINEGRTLRYEAAVAKLGLAVDHWLMEASRRRTRHSPPSPCCVLSLGDIIDGRDDEHKSHADLQAVLSHFRRLPRNAMPALHVVGKHCLKFVRRERLLEELELPASYYRRQLAPGFALLVLDTTELSADTR